ILSELGYLSESGFNALPYSGLVVSVIAIHLIIFFYLRRFYKSIFEDTKRVSLIFLLMNLTLALARAMVIISPFIVPYTFLPMLLTILVKKRVGQSLALYS